MKKIICSVALVAALVWGVRSYFAGDGSAEGPAAEELSGAGATFPLPFYNAVFDSFRSEHRHLVAYGGIGSGGGIRNLKDFTVDFAGSDAFLSDEELGQMPAEVIHIPTCMGAIVVAFNLQGVDRLRLTGGLLARIFAGEVTSWDDPQIRELNPDVALPAERIIPVYRSDGSGSTYVFTDYLCRASSEWKKDYGCDKTVGFPVGIAAKGNPGVAGVIAQTRNSIGYVGSEYAFAQKIACADIRNARGEFVTPDTASISAAARTDIPHDTRTSLTDSPAEGAYPISCFTWMIVYKEQAYAGRSRAHAEALGGLLDYILSDSAQSVTGQVHYAPLPAPVVELSRRNLRTMTFEGKPLFNNTAR